MSGIKYKKRACEICGTLFYPWQKNQKNCSPNCYKQYQKNYYASDEYKLLKKRYNAEYLKKRKQLVAKLIADKLYAKGIFHKKRNGQRLCSCGEKIVCWKGSWFCKFELLELLEEMENEKL